MQHKIAFALVNAARLLCGCAKVVQVTSSVYVQNASMHAMPNNKSSTCFLNYRTIA